MYLLSCSGSWTRYLTLTMWNSTGNIETIGYGQVSCSGYNKSCKCRTNLFSDRIKEKIGPIGICLHKSELKHFLQAKSEDVQAQLKRKQDSQQKGSIGCSSLKLFKQNNVVPNAVGQLKGLLEKSPRCAWYYVIYSPSISFFVSSIKGGQYDMRSKFTLNKHFYWHSFNWRSSL